MREQVILDHGRPSLSIRAEYFNIFGGRYIAGGCACDRSSSVQGIDHRAVGERYCVAVTVLDGCDGTRADVVPGAVPKDQITGGGACATVIVVHYVRVPKAVIGHDERGCG